MLSSLLVFVIGGLFFSAQDSIPVPEIPAYSMLVERHHVTLSEDYSVSHQVTKRLTIFSAEGIDHARVVLGYDKIRQIVDFEAEVIDPLTKKSLKKSKLRDLPDLAAYSQTNIFDDDRLKYFELTSAKFPVQVDIKYEMRSKSNFVLPSWVVVPNYNQLVEESSFKVSYPESMGIKYKELNLTGTKEEGMELNKKSITWTEKKVTPQGRDMEKDDDPKLLLAPVNFGLEGYVGKMEDWEGLGAWQYELNKGRNVLPAEFQQKIKTMIAAAADDYERVAILYDYLQKNFRYVSIQLGIGGWQTMEAKDVLDSGFGDCKGLTNLMKSMLEVAGIASNYTLVYAGTKADDIEVDLPSNQFNHVILQVPTDKDPIWLECTSSILPAGYLGDFTNDRHVLVVKERGGYLTKTPAYLEEAWNKISSKTQLIIDEQGNAKISSAVAAEGNLAVDLLQVKTYLDERQQRDYLNKNSVVSGLLVKDFSIQTDKRDSLLLAEMKYEGLVQRFVQNTAKRVILKPFLGKIQSDLLENGSLAKVDEFEIHLPEALEPDGGLPSVNVEEEGFIGSLEASLDGKILTVTRKIKLQIPEEIENEEKDALLKRVNSAFDKTILFSKPSTNP